MVFEGRFRIEIPRFWRWLLPTYAAGYREGLKDAQRAGSSLNVVAAHCGCEDWCVTCSNSKAKGAFVGEGGALLQE